MRESFLSTAEELAIYARMAKQFASMTVNDWVSLSCS